jgi:hypothetical protein
VFSNYPLLCECGKPANNLQTQGGHRFQCSDCRNPANYSLPITDVTCEWLERIADSSSETICMTRYHFEQFYALALLHSCNEDDYLGDQEILRRALKRIEEHLYLFAVLDNPGANEELEILRLARIIRLPEIHFDKHMFGIIHSTLYKMTPEFRRYSQLISADFTFHESSSQAVLCAMFASAARCGEPEKVKHLLFNLRSASFGTTCDVLTKTRLSDEFLKLCFRNSRLWNAHRAVSNNMSKCPCEFCK